MMKGYCDLNKWSIHCVKGHQKGKDLVCKAQLNNLVDEMASLAQESLPLASRNRTPPLYPAGDIMVLINNKVITREIASKIHQTFTLQDIREYKEKTFQWNAATADSIDWEMQRSNLLTLPFYQHKFVGKLIHERLLCLGKKFTVLASKTCPVCKTHR
eukprot:12940020-Ditylum_brightwellii.AAC.1